MSKRLFGFLCVCALLFCGFCMLGIWQVQRLHWKEKLIADYQQRSTGPVTPLIAQAGQNYNISEWQNRRVILQGRYQSKIPNDNSDPNLYLESKVLNEQIGYYVFTPLLLPDKNNQYLFKKDNLIVGYSTVWINRGWIPLKARGHVPPPKGDVTIEGIVHPSLITKPFFMPATQIGENYEIAKLFWVDLDEMNRHCCLFDTGPHLPFYVDAVQSGPAVTGQPIPVGGTLDLPNNHLQYAITWFALAAITAIMSVLYVRKTLKSKA